jgi:hypothetical protein
MPVNRERLQKLVSRIGEFYITDKGMKKAQARMTDLLTRDAVDDREADAYLQAVNSYFSGFESEARTHLRTLDKRLEQVNQVHFNLTAERNVAVRRIEGTRSVLEDVSQLQGGGVGAG